MVTATGAQTMGRTYASVVAQTKDTGEKIDVDGASEASREVSKPADPAAAGLVGTVPAVNHTEQAFVVHRVACSRPWGKKWGG